MSFLTHYPAANTWIIDSEWAGTVSILEDTREALQWIVCTKVLTFFHNNCSYVIRKHIETQSNKPG